MFGKWTFYCGFHIATVYQEKGIFSIHQHSYGTNGIIKPAVKSMQCESIDVLTAHSHPASTSCLRGQDALARNRHAVLHQITVTQKERKKTVQHKLSILTIFPETLVPTQGGGIWGDDSRLQPAFVHF